MDDHEFRKVLLLMLAILSVHCKCTGSTEPRCSRFEIEERLLEKLVRQEVAMEQMKDQTLVTSNRLEKCMHEVDRLTLDLNSAKDEVVELKKDLAIFKTDIMNTIEIY
ncbi:hypothetical protein MAR_036133 [Mya arenaria]|uniref:Uncharacterized protein n=1 Tax=Mya arenaria TaxID=6604 RepID=A0ABY7EPP9_MYAAR|nr:hypothetical protein MAR_036133 [Mya arenaria]